MSNHPNRSKRRIAEPEPAPSPLSVTDDEMAEISDWVFSRCLDQTEPAQRMRECIRTSNWKRALEIARANR